MRLRIVVIGDTLLDIDLDGRVERLCPDAPAPVLDDAVEHPRPGGAGLAAALLAKEDCDVTLITPIADDNAGHRLRTLLHESGVVVVAMGLDGSTTEKVRVRASGHSIVRLDRGEGIPGPITLQAVEALERADAVLVADYGRGVTKRKDVRPVLQRIAQQCPVVWDPHPRGAPPICGATLITPNRNEAFRWSSVVDDGSVASVSACAYELARTWNTEGVCITLGEAGALYKDQSQAPPLIAPALSFDAPDACGAGDRFAGAATLALARNASPFEAVTDAVAAASAFIGAGGAAAWTLPTAPTAPAPVSTNANDVITRVRATGGRVVATGGCFDLLHAGHVRLLQTARQLGECLVVCLNSDASISRLKGPGRPIVPEADRIAVLLGLEAVDAVVVFDDSTPVPVLQRLRPDVFAKGGDYEGREIDESPVVASWGGTCVVLPYAEGRSTTNLMKEVLQRGSY